MSAKKLIPKHIAIIMDGNGRWAKMRNLPRMAGHRRGADVVKSIVRYCNSAGVGFLTLYAFSTENWKRPKDEINFLMELLGLYLKKEIKTLVENNVRFSTIGEIEKLPEKAKQIIAEAKSATEQCTGLTFVLALSYGARAEIKNAAILLSEDIRQGKILTEEVNEDVFANYLYTAGMPDPDLLIRTSGEMRISNFLLWQLSYAELYITDSLWPDFDEKELKRAIEEFGNRKRRFGGL